MTNPGNASDSSNEYKSSSEPVPKTSPCDADKLKAALIRLQEEFNLLDEEIQALPTLAEVSLIPQEENHAIASLEGYRDARSFKLYVGEKKWDDERCPAFVYLFKNKNSKKKESFEMKICRGDNKGLGWEPMPIRSFGDVSDLAYPFNGKVSVGLRIAVAKWYFLLGFEAGLYGEDPGFRVTDEWQRHLHAACNDLKQANAVEALQEQNRASSANTTPPAAADKSPQPQVLRTHLPSAKQQNETMADDTGKKRQSRRKDRDHPPGTNSRPSHSQQLDHGGSRAIHGPQVSGFGSAPPGPDTYGASPLPPAQSPHYAYYPPTTMSSFMPNSGAPTNSRPGPTDQFEGGYGQPTPSQSKSVSKSSGPAPIIVEPRRGSRLHTQGGVQTEATSKGQRATPVVSRYTTLEEEYAALYQKREEIGIRMEEIKRSLPAERYTALMAKLDPQELPTLKPWSDNTGN